jgi:hypothetical protein
MRATTANKDDLLAARHSASIWSSNEWPGKTRTGRFMAAFYSLRVEGGKANVEEGGGGVANGLPKMSCADVELSHLTFLSTPANE